MKEKSPLPRAVVAFAILAVALVSGGMLMQSGRFRSANAATASARLLDEVMARVQHDYIDSLPRSELLQRAASGLVLELEDPYSALLSPERFRRVREQTTGQYAGLGLELDQREGEVTVIAPLAGTPADSAGIRPGDRIVSINGRPVAGMAMDSVEQGLRGPRGSRVSLTIERDNVLDPIELTLTRRNIEVRAVQHAELLAGGTAYVRFAAFNERAAVELAKTIDSLRAAGATALILDLRSNPGGLLDEGVAAADLFLDAGVTIASIRGRTADANHEYNDDAAQRWPGLPIAALVDSGTASAAEIVAGALQDHDRAILVGSPTYGKGSAQSVFPMDDGKALKLTTARWFTPDGRSIERDSTTGGITPDVVVRQPMMRFSRDDAVVRRAAELLLGVKTPPELRRRVPERDESD
jgi:carboxyl-terminal processing protease